MVFLVIASPPQERRYFNIQEVEVILSFLYIKGDTVIKTLQQVFEAPSFQVLQKCPFFDLSFLLLASLLQAFSLKCNCNKTKCQREKPLLHTWSLIPLLIYFCIVNCWCCIIFCSCDFPFLYPIVLLMMVPGTAPPPFAPKDLLLPPFLPFLPGNTSWSHWRFLLFLTFSTLFWQPPSPLSPWCPLRLS